MSSNQEEQEARGKAIMEAIDAKIPQSRRELAKITVSPAKAGLTKVQIRVRIPSVGQAGAGQLYLAL
jgi:hypothetical protein